MKVFSKLQKYTLIGYTQSDVLRTLQGESTVSFSSWDFFPGILLSIGYLAALGLGPWTNVIYIQKVYQI